MYSDRQFAIFNVSEIGLIEFDKVLETDVSTLRYSNDKTKTFVKWNGNEPEFISNMTTIYGKYSYDEMVELLNNDEWSVKIEL